MPDLSFSLGGDISAFERAMNAALTLGKSSSDKLVAVFKASSDRIDQQFGTSLKSALASATGLDRVLNGIKIAGGVLIGFEALKAIIDLTNKAAADAAKELQHLVDIGNKARDAQVGSTFFQGFVGQAKELGAEASQLEGILTAARDNFRTNIGEGTGQATSTVADRVAQNVKAGNLSSSASQDLASADSLEAKYRVSLGLLDQLQQKGALLAEYDLAGKMFGPDFENKLRQGVDIIGSMRQALDGVSATSEGRVQTEQEIANALRIQAEYTDQNKRLAEAWAPVEALIGEYEQGQLQSMADLREIYVEVVSAAASLVGWLAKAANYVSALGNGEFFKNLVSGMNSLGMITDPDIKRQLDAGHADPDPNAPRPLTIRRRHDTSRSLPSLAAPRAASPAGGSQSDPVESYLKSLSKTVAAEKAEAETLGLGNKAKQEAVDLAKAMEAARDRGSALTEAERQKVLGLADAYTVAKQRIDDYAAGQAHAADQAKFLGDTFESAIDGMVTQGETLQSTLLNIVKALEQAALKALILGEGPLAGLFGTAPKTGATGAASVGGFFGLLMKTFADGGSIVGPGGPRSDSIPILASHGEYIVNASAARANRPLLDAMNFGGLRHFADGGMISPAAMPVPVMAPSGGTALQVHAPFTVDARGAQAGVADQIQSAIGVYHQNLQRNIVGIVDQAQRRRLR